MLLMNNCPWRANNDSPKLKRTIIVEELTGSVLAIRGKKNGNIIIK